MKGPHFVEEDLNLIFGRQYSGLKVEYTLLLTESTTGTTQTPVSSSNCMLWNWSPFFSDSSTDFGWIQMVGAIHGTVSNLTRYAFELVESVCELHPTATHAFVYGVV